VLGGLANQVTGNESLDIQAYKYFDRVVDQAPIIFKREPEYEKVMFGLTRKYLGSKVVQDDVAAFFAGKAAPERPKTAAMPYSAPSRQEQPKAAPAPVAPIHGQGYCIRTGAAIPFNVKRPFSDEAYRSWSRYKDENYAEKFCHFSGEPSNGETSYAKPILRKNWSQAKAKFGL
jgi:hypothetical protein